MNFKKILSFILVAILIFGLIPVSAAPVTVAAPKVENNMLIGGDFEDRELSLANFFATYESPGALSWHANGGMNDSAYVRVPIPATDGKHACLMYTPGSFQLRQGAVYALSVDVYDPSGALRFVSIDFQEGGWDTFGQEETFRRGPADTGWRTFTSYFQFTGTGSLTLRVFGQSNGTKSGQYFCVDNLSMVEVTDNLFIGGDMDNESMAMENFLATYESPGMTWLANGGVDGSGCISLEIPATASQNACLMYSLNTTSSRGMMLMTGQLYTVSCDVWLPEGGLHWITMDFQEDSYSTFHKGEIFKQVSTTGSWQHIEATFRYEDPTSTLFMRIFGGSMGNAGKAVKIDNVKLTFADRENLVRNGDFSDRDNLISAFFIDGNDPYRGGGLSWQAGGTDNGGCLRMDAISGVANALMVRDLTTSNNWLRVTNGKVYNVSVDVYRPAGMTGTVALGFETMPNGYDTIYKAATKTGEWETLSITFVANGDQNVSPYVRSMAWYGTWLRDGEYVLLDNFSLVCLSDAKEAPQWTPASQNLVRSGAFSSEVYAKLDYYATYEASGLNWNPTGGVDNSACVSMAAPQSGYACLKYHLDSIRDGVELVKDRWYTLSCDVFIPENSVEWMAIDFEMDAWNNWAVESKSAGYANRIGTKGSWQHLYMTFKYTDDTAMQTLRIFGPAGSGNAEVKIDNVSLRCLNDPSIVPAFEPIPSELAAETVTVLDENNIQVVFTEAVTGLNTITVPVAALDSNGAVLASVMIPLTKGANDKTFTGTLTPTAGATHRSFSALWQTAAANNGTLVLDMDRDAVIEQTDFAFNPNPFSIKEVKQVGLNTLTVTFTEDIDFATDGVLPYVCLRMIDPNTGLMLFNGEWPIQWAADSVELCEEGDTLLVTFPEQVDIGLLVSKINMDARFIPYDVMLCIQENPTDHFVAANHLVHQIRRANDGKQLDASFKVTDAVSWDAVYANVTVLDPLREDIAIEEVEIIDQTRIVVTFSEAVVLDNPEAYIRLVNEQLDVKVTEDGNMMWSGRVEYYNKAKTKVAFILNDSDKNHATVPVDGLADLFSRGYETDGYELRLVISDTGWKPYRNGIVDSIVGTTGKILLADPMNYDIDSVWLELDGTQVPTGELHMVKAEVVSDVEGIITFSNPVAFEEWCFFAVRFLDDKDWLIWRTPDGEYSSTGYEIEGSSPLQWSCTWEWNNKEHTEIRFKIAGDGTDNMYNFNDLFAIDWASLVEGGRLAVGFEELGDMMITDNGRVDNIRLEDDRRVALSASYVGNDRDSAWVDLDVKYQPKTLTYSAKILNETQIRITFSQPITIVSDPYIVIRYTDENNVLVYNEDIYNRFALQFNGTWEKESNNSIIWTMSGHSYYNTRTLYDVVNFTGGLAQFKDSNVKLCIEELNSETFKTGNNNDVVENIATLDGANHLRANRRSGYDGSYITLDGSMLKGDRLNIVSAVALDDQHVEITFNRPVSIAEGTSLGVRYLTPSGDSETLVDGRSAYFKGDWEYKSEDKTVILWTLNSRHTDNLTDVFNFNGNFMWNKGARIAFAIMDEEDNQAPDRSMRIQGVTTLDGYLMLEANYAKKGTMMSQADMRIDYELPAPIVQNEAEVDRVTYTTDYLPVMIAASVVVIGGVIGMALLIVVRKKEGK